MFRVQLLESLVLQHYSPLFGFLLCVHGGQQLHSHRVGRSVPVFDLLFMLRHLEGTSMGVVREQRKKVEKSEMRV